MKNNEVLTLVRLGLLDITAHTLDAKDAYKIVKLKKAIKEKLADLQKAEQELVKECGIDDAEAFDAALEKLRLNEPSSPKRAEMEAKVKKVNEMRSVLFEEQFTLEGVKAMPYESWKKLQDENNKDGRDILVGQVEDILENILWFAPEDYE